MCDSASLVALLDGALDIEPCLSAVETVRAQLAEGLAAVHERVVYRALAAALGRIAAFAAAAGPEGDWSAYCDTIDVIRTTTFCDPAPATTEWSGRAFLCKALATLSLPQAQGAALSEEAFAALYDCVAAIATAPESATRTAQEIRVAQNTLPTIVSAPANSNAAVAVFARRSQNGDEAAQKRLEQLAHNGVAQAKQHLIAGVEPAHAAKLFARTSDGAAVKDAVAFFAPKHQHGKRHQDSASTAAVTSDGVAAIEAAAKALRECKLTSSADGDDAATSDAGEAAIDAAIYASNVLEVLGMCRPTCLRGDHATNECLAAATSLLNAIHAIWTALTATPDTIAKGLGGHDAATALLYNTQQWVMMLPHHPAKRAASSSIVRYDSACWATFTLALADLLRSTARVCIPEAPAAAEQQQQEPQEHPVQVPAAAEEAEASASPAKEGDDGAAVVDAVHDVASAKPSASPVVEWAASLNPLFVEIQLEVLLNGTFVTHDVLRAAAQDPDGDSGSIAGTATVSAATLRALVAAFEPAQAALAEYVANTAEAGSHRRRDEGRKHGGRGNRDAHRRSRGQQNSELQSSSEMATQRLAIVRSIVCRAQAVLGALEAEGPAATAGYKLLHGPSWRA